MTSARSVLIALAIAVVVFVATHLLNLPGSLRELMAASGGQPILDQQPSFSTEELYQRLQAFGVAGRDLYKRFVVTTDIVFPLSLLAFLFLLARFTSGRLLLWPAVGAALAALPIIWFALDMTENLSILVLLSQFPERDEGIAASLGYVSLAKRYALLASLFAPLAMLLVAGARRLLFRPV